MSNVEMFIAHVRCPACKVRAEVIVEYGAQLQDGDAETAAIRLKIKQHPGAAYLPPAPPRRRRGPTPYRLFDARELAAGEGFDDD